MIYLNENNLKEIGVVWEETVKVIESAVKCINNGDYAQPIKPYLRYGDLKNRIIAMPGFVGGEINISGIKWIASFPDNIESGIPRAHSVVILNKAETGQPVAVINTALLSIIRTASVSGLIIKKYNEVRQLKDIKLGIIGWGPIGQNHFNMCCSLFGDRISKIYLYDKRPIIDIDKIDYKDKSKIIISNSWQEAYDAADIFITCTVSKASYIDKKPKVGSLHLNVSLRDYKTDVFEYFKNSIIVDDWDEVCRENTDIEIMHNEKGLQKENTKSIVDAVCKNCLEGYGTDDVVMFNPMGMGIFDVSIGAYYVNKALEKNVGLQLE